jgi:hypothetical protein
MKRLVLALALIASPLSAWAACGHLEQQAMSCAEGYLWDQTLNQCVPVVTG